MGPTLDSGCDSPGRTIGVAPALSRRTQVYDALARLCEYPGEDTPVVAQALVAALEAPPAAVLGTHPVAALGAGAATSASGTNDRCIPIARAFGAFVGDLPLHDLEEIYVRTFDLHAAVCLDVGYQLFGETYKRGAFLVTMKGAARRHDLQGTVELSDHLSVALRLLGRLAPEEDPDELVRDALIPALAKMRLGLGKQRAGYALLLDLVDAVLRADFADALRSAPAGEALPFRLPVVSDTSHFEGINDRD